MTLNPSPPQGARTQAKNIRVILVEDNHDLRQSLAGHLRLNGIEVTDVPTGAAFHQALRIGTFDIAILDVNLPDISGFTLAGQLAAERRMGIILLTARTGRDDQVHGYAEGADLYLTKPVDSEALMLAVRNLARRVDMPAPAIVPGAEADRSVTPRSWQLDLVRQSLRSPDGQPVALTSREMVLMEHLARAQGATISRAILSAALGYDLTRDSRSLDAVMHRLRQKFRRNRTAAPRRPRRRHSIHCALVEI